MTLPSSFLPHNRINFCLHGYLQTQTSRRLKDPDLYRYQYKGEGFEGILVEGVGFEGILGEGVGFEGILGEGVGLEKKEV